MVNCRWCKSTLILHSLSRHQGVCVGYQSISTSGYYSACVCVCVSILFSIIFKAASVKVVVLKAHWAVKPAWDCLADPQRVFTAFSALVWFYSHKVYYLNEGLSTPINLQAADSWFFFSEKSPINLLSASKAVSWSLVNWAECFKCFTRLGGDQNMTKKIYKYPLTQNWK